MYNVGQPTACLHLCGIVAVAIVELSDFVDVSVA